MQLTVSDGVENVHRSNPAGLSRGQEAKGTAATHRARTVARDCADEQLRGMIRKLKSGEFRLYSRRKDPQGKRRNLGTFKTLAAAKRHERAVQFFKRH